MLDFHIHQPDSSLLEAIKHKIDFKTKPLGALGRLEDLSKKICLIQQTTTPELTHPTILVFAGDHGLAREGVSAFPQEVTHQMVMNFLAGGAAISVFCKLHQLNLQIIDAGVNYTFETLPNLINKKVGYGTKNSLTEEAMTPQELEQAIQAGTQLVLQQRESGCNIIGFGEMGIGNTSAASLLMAALTGISINDCIGRGTGVDEKGLAHKVKILQAVYDHHQDKTSDPMAFFRSVAGYEMAMMLGAMLQAAESKMILLVDGFIASSVYLMAHRLYPAIEAYAIFCHQSNEQGHSKMLESVSANSILHLDLRLGEGTGCALAYPLIQSSVAFINDMASFESAAVSQKS
ncbi:nicotinate-nucleotide--dimethylbenzimidazole phosphoribosyltransferase [Reichenbachiella agarivorans]|uniref:Nicotinate-nucleotide--dimethylbenzimidazole phosphoribosyltransferase n=1 Tax=Reichenbachiella agarivorans TaxID=2979464 RepID=A0ABY6CKJ1_9BACT|nr:nicotinate-nucleotide--dimethylbenzimidazole phosphoribosyltransferase [Reichenbachiella agarivorans]UXP31044.1 nicotinate-nucleotide--dimethylbenzimidazole phosphoribosyltransferase [Reichenbachiella agarivorans]